MFNRKTALGELPPQDSTNADTSTRSWSPTSCRCRRSSVRPSYSSRTARRRTADDRAFLDEEDVNRLHHPAMSPDLNPGQEGPRNGSPPGQQGGAAHGGPQGIE
ncbi:hypothetical protein FOCC_FOCC015161 [Frankliniella occidentalis]|nr:hypothetical protein FOCC_FOCC015161 [Frankliniella occidentalis]